MRSPALARRLSPSLPLALALAVTLAPGAAAAKPKVCTAKERKEAGALADKAYEHFEAADYQAAIESFSQAEEKCHSPRLLVFIARAHARLGQLLRARDLLQQAADEPITRRSPASFREAQVEARKDLEALKPRIPVIQVMLTGAPAAEATVTLDGEEVPIEELSRGRELDPGEHSIQVEAPGMEPAERHLVLRESVVERIEILLRAPKPEPPPAPPEGPSLVPPVLAFGLGAVGLGVGAVTGLVSASKVSDIKSRCEGTSCLRSDAAAADDAALLGNVSTAAFILGGVGVATGAVLLLVRSGGDEKPDESARLEVGVGLGGVRVGGTF